MIRFCKVSKINVFLTIVAVLILLSQQGDIASRAAASSQRQNQSDARVLGVIAAGNDWLDNVITAPASVKAGKDFQVTITTSGGGCERAGDTGVVMTENSATVMVYDFTSATHPGVACTMIYKRLPHSVTLCFTKPGEAIIRIWGRRSGGATSPFGEPAIFEHRVMVK
jgi:hypothetical protein